AVLRTNRTSWRVAPAARAARMWRRVPSGFRPVRVAFNPTDTNSTNFLGKIPLVDGSVVIFTASSAQVGSHSRSLLSAATQELADRSAGEAFAISSPVAILFPPLGVF